MRPQQVKIRAQHKRHAGNKFAAVTPLVQCYYQVFRDKQEYERLKWALGNKSYFNEKERKTRQRWWYAISINIAGGDFAPLVYLF